MNRIEFIPKEFHQVEIEAGSVNSGKTVCTPGYPDTLWIFNEILLNCPDEIICYIDKPQEDVKIILPVCIYFVISNRRSLKYHDLKNTVHIRKVGNNVWDSGIVELLYDNGVPKPNHIEKAKTLERERAEAQHYSDSELNTGNGGGGFINFNLFDFIKTPITSGEYEVYFSKKGLESNHCFVDIEIEKS